MEVLKNKPASIFRKYQEYMNVYYQFYTADIKDKNYDTTLIRWLIIFFLYRENDIGNKFTMDEIASVFGLKNKTTITRSNQKIRDFITYPDKIKKACINKTKFVYFYYRYNKIFNEKMQ